MPSDAEPEGGQRLVRMRGRGGRGTAPELRTPYEEVPPEVSDPRFRKEPTIGVIELTNDGHAVRGTAPPPLDVPGADPRPPEVLDRSDDTLRTFDDLMAAFPFGDVDGQYYMHVERKQPQAMHGIATKGVMRRLRDRITFEQFKQVYGGGVYDLIVYGPPTRGGMPDPVTGRPVPKALSKIVRVTIPWHLDGGIPPNRDAAYDDPSGDGTEEDMANGNGDGGIAGIPGRMFRHGVSPAAATVVQHQLKHQEEMDARRAARRQERMEQRTHRENTAMTLLERQAEARAEALQNQLAETKRELRDMRSKGESSVDGAVKLLEHISPRAPQSEITEIRETHRREAESLARAHKSEVESLQRMNREDHDRLVAQHQSALDRAEDRVRDATRRSEERIREVEAQMDRERNAWKTDLAREQDRMRADHDRQVAYMTGEHQRALEAQRTQYETVISSERRQAERDGQTRDQIATSVLTTEKKTLEVEMNAKERELKALRRELDAAQVALTKSKDLTQLLEDARAQAEALGYIPASEGNDKEEEDATWKSVFKTMMTEGMKNLPQILQSAQQAVTQMRGGAPQTQAAPQQQRMMPPGMPMPQQMQAPLVGMPQHRFATEAAGIQPPATGPEFYPVRRSVAPPPEVGQTHIPAPPPAPAAPAPAPEGMPPAAPLAVAPPAGGHLPMQAEMPPMAQNIAPGPGPAAAAPAMSPEQTAQLDQAILASVETLEQAFVAETPPEVLAELVITKFGKEHVRTQLPQFSPANVLGAIGRSGVQTRLTSRAGKKFLRAIEEKVLVALR